MTLTSGGFRLFGENISGETEIEVIPTSAASGTDAGMVTTGAGGFPDITTTFTAASGNVPAYITVTPESAAPGGTFWIRGRNPGSIWSPAPVIAQPGGG